MTACPRTHATIAPTADPDAKITTNGHLTTAEYGNSLEIGLAPEVQIGLPLAIPTKRIPQGEPALTPGIEIGRAKEAT